jgi:hypothetical protein
MVTGGPADVITGTTLAGVTMLMPARSRAKNRCAAAPRKEVERVLAAVPKAPSESAVREMVGTINGKIAALLPHLLHDGSRHAMMRWVAYWLVVA